MSKIFNIFILILLFFNLLINTNFESKYLPHNDQLVLALDSRLLLASKSNDNDQNAEYIPTITIDRTEKVVDEYRYNITDKEFKEFVRVVEAEVTGSNPFGVGYKEAFNSKLRVAQVILNRVESSGFPDTVHDVIFQKNAFTPLLDGRYYEVEISQVTIDACKTALLKSTKDLTNGCEFFSSGTKTCKYGSYVFTDSVGHSFFKSY